MPASPLSNQSNGRGRRVEMAPHQTVRHVPLTPHELIEDITPQADLFVLAHLGVPRINIKNWTLTITGLVCNNATFTFDQIRQFRKREIQAFHQCAGFPKIPRLATRRVGNVVWGGVDLQALLESVGVLSAARFLWSFGLDYGEYDGIRSDPYVKDLPLDRLSHGDVLLAYEINGEPLDALHGYPLRLIYRDFTGPIPSNGCRVWSLRTAAPTVRSRPFSTTTRLLLRQTIPAVVRDRFGRSLRNC